MPYVTANGLELFYEDSGGEGPVLVFSHGLLMDRTMFGPQVEQLRRTYRCISWDQRGFGRTGPVEHPFTYWTSAQDALALLSALNIEKAAFAGLSQGGFLSMRAALLAPERVSALILLATRAGTDDAQSIENFRGLSAEWKAKGSANVQGMLEQVLLGPNVNPEPWVSNWRTMGHNDMAYPLDTLMERDDITDKLASLTCPSIVIHGADDIAIAIEHGRQLAQGLPACKGFHDIAGAGHAVNLASPSLVTGIIQDFLANDIA